MQDFSTLLLKFILKRNGGDLEAAREVVQDTYAAALSSFHTFHHKSTYFTWLCAISLRKLADYYRGQVHQRSRIVAPTIEQLSGLVSPELSPVEVVAANELHVQLSRCLNLLPPEYRQLLHLKYYEELSNKEICLKLHLTPRKLEGRLYRAKKTLAHVVSTTSPHLKP